MKRKRVFNLAYWIVMAGLLVWFAYTKGWILANFQSVTPKEAITLLQQDENVTLLDVRTPQEFQSGHLPHATLIPLDRLEANLDKLTPYKRQKILVYCRSGSRSLAASRILEKHGFIPVNIKEGIIGLSSAGAQIIR